MYRYFTKGEIESISFRGAAVWFAGVSVAFWLLVFPAFALTVFFAR